MDFEREKRILLDELRNSGIQDEAVMDALARVPRELFMAPLFRDRAYDNVALPIGQHQTISQPLIVAMMTQALQLGDRMRVLEVGTGSGYQAAVLAQLARRVYTIERHAPLLREAERRFSEMGLTNITTRLGDGIKGWREQSPFDRIMVTAAAESVPENLVAQLAPGGIMVLPLGGQTEIQQLVCLRRTGRGYRTENLVPVRFVPLLPGVASYQSEETS